MAQDSKTPTGDDAIRDVIRKTVAENKPMTLDALGQRYEKGGVPHIKMGQLRKLMAANLSQLQQELAAAKDAAAKAQAGAQAQIDKANAEAKAQLEKERAEFEKRLELEREKAKAAGEQAGAKRELDAAQVRISELEEALNKHRTEWDSERGRLESENLKLNNIVESMDISKHEEFIRKIKELEEQLQAARDSLAEAQTEIRRLMCELRYAEPIIEPDHGGVSSAASKVDSLTSGLSVEANRAVSRAVNYVRYNEERCQAELPKLIERMNNLEASFPQVARMVKLATLHEENRRWLAVLDGVLSN